MTILNTIPIIPLRNTVAFPETTMSLIIQRPTSVNGLKTLIDLEDKYICLVTQKSTEDINHIYNVGVLAKIVELQFYSKATNERSEDKKLSSEDVSDITAKIIVNCEQKIKIQDFYNIKGYIELKSYESIKDVVLNEEDINIKINLLQNKFEQYLKLLKNSLPHQKKSIEVISQLTASQPNLETKVNYVASYIYTSELTVNDDKTYDLDDISSGQKVLEENYIDVKIDLIIGDIGRKASEISIEAEIEAEANEELKEEHRKVIIRKKIDIMRKSIGDMGVNYISKLEESISKINSDLVRNKLKNELNKLSSLNQYSPEFAGQKNWVEFNVNLPWNEGDETNLRELSKFNARKISEYLDERLKGNNHAKKAMISAYASNLSINPESKEVGLDTICLYGPPGTGKTKLSQIFAEAIGRKCVVISCGGAGNESKLKGHRRTYVGAKPGELFQAIHDNSTTRLVVILDEVDKIPAHHYNSGELSSVIMNLLDPAIRRAFKDNYVDIEFDISKIIFVATANNIENLHPALRDRMVLLEVSSYSLEEKLSIAKDVFIPRLQKRYSVNSKVIFNNDSLKFIIQRYTREAGVRNLLSLFERIFGDQLSKYLSADKNLDKSAGKENEPINIDGVDYPDTLENPQESSYSYDENYGYMEIILSKANIVRFLNPPRYKEKDSLEDQDKNNVGNAKGLAYSSVGGSVLDIQAVLTQGTGKLCLTGRAGEVMKESASVAHNLIKSIRGVLVSANYDLEELNKYDIHVHLPEGAVPKDGPSAGITMTTAIVSALLNAPIDNLVAMTGEIDLKGKVLPVGGLKEKILAASRYGIKTVILSKKNMSDINDILYEEKVKSAEEFFELNLVYVDRIEDVLKIAIPSIKESLEDKPPVLSRKSKASKKNKDL